MKLPHPCADMSPALRRYYRNSALPCLVFLLLSMAQRPALDALGTGSGNIADVLLALLPMPALLWMCSVYLRFLRECDELERRIELHALVWSAGIVLNVGMALVFLLSAQALVLDGARVAMVLTLLLIIGFTLIRSLLHWQYR